MTPAPYSGYLSLSYRVIGQSIVTSGPKLGVLSRGGGSSPVRWTLSELTVVYSKSVLGFSPALFRRVIVFSHK